MSKILKGHQVEALTVEFRESETFSGLTELFRAKEAKEDRASRPSLEEELERIKRESYEEGYQEGQKEGYGAGYKEGFEKGRREGFEKGRADAQAQAEKELSSAKARLEKEYQERIKAIEDLFSTFKREFSESVLGLDREVLALVERISEKLLFKALEEDEELILRVIREALKEVVEGARVTVKVSPEEAKRLEGLDLRALSDRSFPRLEIQPDPGISKGGCLLETSFGLVEATVERRWEEIFKALREVSSGED